MISSKSIDKIISLIVDYYAPDQVFVFGSQAKGSADVRSDLDLMVIKDTLLSSDQRGVGLRYGLFNFPVKVDLVFLTNNELKAQLKRDSSFVSSIWHSAKLVFKNS